MLGVGVVSLKEFNNELQSVLQPFIDFINDYPGVFRLEYGENGYNLIIDLHLLKLATGTPLQVAE